MVVNGMVWITITIMDVNKKCQKKSQEKIGLVACVNLPGLTPRVSPRATLVRAKALIQAALAPNLPSPDVRCSF